MITTVRSPEDLSAVAARAAVQPGALLSPLQMMGRDTTCPGARVRVSLLASGKQSLLPQIR